MMYGLNLKDIGHINNVFSRHPNVEKAILYGSRAKGTQRYNSDIDLVMIGSISLVELYQIKEEIDEILLPYKVDLSLFEKIENKDLIDHIQRVGRNFFHRN
jgi:predicted nucleotidyltransferase